MDLKSEAIELVPELNLKLAFIPVGEVMVEFMEPTGAGAYKDFLERWGKEYIIYAIRWRTLEKRWKRWVKSGSER